MKMKHIQDLMSLIFREHLNEKTYLSWLAQVGFKHVETFTDFNIDEHNEDAERLFFIAKK